MGACSPSCPSPKLRPAGKWLIYRLWSGDNLSSMITLLLHLLRLLPFLFGGHRQLALENIALRQQLAVYRRTVTRPKLHTTDRLFWVGLARVWAGWRQPLVIVTPETCPTLRSTSVHGGGDGLMMPPPCFGIAPPLSPASWARHRRSPSEWDAVLAKDRPPL